MNGWRGIGPIALGLTLMSSVAVAQQERTPRALAITAENVTAQEQGRQGADTREGESAAYPGDVIRYRLVFTNVTDLPVRNVEFTDAIPAGLIYQQHSSTSDAANVVVDYSIDGGSSYHARPFIEKIVDADSLREPAPVELYTHIRWRVQEWVQPGSRVSVEFRAALPDNTERNNASSSRGREG